MKLNKMIKDKVYLQFLKELSQDMKLEKVVKNISNTL